ncbi:hypothetical protein CEXT_654741 [Caerostris extrusa]|uniref:Uncharacterized protein n=1 Tax=Caerostris extrusa TaxID=172846 RepID=A0AAV4V987_CAEEX|nr:hypothetical protein CEXT_654741 [Caerostris extrusa]
MNRLLSTHLLYYTARWRRRRFWRRYRFAKDTTQLPVMFYLNPISFPTCITFRCSISCQVATEAVLATLSLRQRHHPIACHVLSQPHLLPKMHQFTVLSLGNNWRKSNLQDKIFIMGDGLY